MDELLGFSKGRGKEAICFDLLLIMILQICRRKKQIIRTFLAIKNT